MKLILVILLNISVMFSKTVDVDIQAEYFESNDEKNIVIFRGSVYMVKGLDTLVCDEIILKTKLNKKTNKKDIITYDAKGNVSFTIKNETTDLIGNGDKVTYDIEKQLYIVIGNGYIEDKLNNKIIKGDNIYMNQKTKHIRINGNKKVPAQFKFTIQTK